MSMSFSAKRSAYSDMPSEVSHSAVVDITFRPWAFAPRKHNTAAVERHRERGDPASSPP
jgi:hypothetical protein